MSKNGNDIFVGEFNVSDDKCDGSDRSESSSDSSLSEERYKKTPKRVQKVWMTPGSTITLQPDAFRGAMNPDETVSSSTGIERNSRGDNNLEESGNGLNNSSTITPKWIWWGNDPDSSQTETTQESQKFTFQTGAKGSNDA